VLQRKVLDLYGQVLGLVHDRQVLRLGLGLDDQVLGLGLEGLVLVNISGHLYCIYFKHYTVELS